MTLLSRMARKTSQIGMQVLAPAPGADRATDCARKTTARLQAVKASSKFAPTGSPFCRENRATPHWHWTRGGAQSVGIPASAHQSNRNRGFPVLIIIQRAWSCKDQDST